MKNLSLFTSHWYEAPILKSESGKIGYIVAWLLGVPASLLFLIFLIRGR